MPKRVLNFRYLTGVEFNDESDGLPALAPIDVNTETRAKKTSHAFTRVLCDYDPNDEDQKQSEGKVLKEMKVFPAVNRTMNATLALGAYAIQLV